MSTAVAATSTSTTRDLLHRLVLERNAVETEPFLAVHSSHVSLLNSVDELQRHCHSLQRQRLDQQQIIDELSSEAMKKNGPSRLEERQKETIDSLQKELQQKWKSEAASSAELLSVTQELKRLQEAHQKQTETLERLQAEHATSLETVEKLRESLLESQSQVQLTEMQYDGLKDTIRRLQQELDTVQKSHDELLTRVVSEKEKSVEEMNQMNQVVESLQREVAMLRDLLAQEEARRKQLEEPASTTDGAAGLGGTVDEEDVTTRKWSPTTAVVVPTKPKHVLQAHSSEATAVRYDASGSDFLATSSSDGSVRLWNAGTGQSTMTFRGGSSQPLLGMDLSTQLLVACGTDKTCRVWNLRTQRLVHQLAGHSNKVTCARLFPSDKFIISASADRTMKTWDISRSTYKQTETLRHSSTVYSMDITRNGNVVVSGHVDGGVRFWDVRGGGSGGGGRENLTMDLASLHVGGVTSVQFHPQHENTILTNGRDSILRLLDVRTGAVVAQLEDDDFRTTSSYASSCFSPDGAHVAAGSGTTGDLLVWQLSDLTRVAKLRGAHTMGICGVAWGGAGGSNGGASQVASIDKSGALILWT